MKILVLQLKRIGDLILTTPALVALRARYPQARITLCIPEASASLAPALPGVDEVLLHRPSGGGCNTELWRRLALGHFDVCLDFTGTDRSAFFALLSKAPRRIAFRRVQKSGFRQFFYSDLVASSVRENHTVDHLLNLLQPLGITDHSAPVTLHVSPEARAEALRLLEDAGVGQGRFVLVHPGTARPEKYWLPERWASVIDHCQSVLGLPCVMTGTTETVERAHIQAIKAAALTPIHDLSGKGSLLTLAALISKAHLLLSMDSSPVHFGAAFGTRQVSLFGETNPFHWHPRHDRSAILMAGKPEPLREFSPTFSRRPLSDLSTDAVTAAIASVI